VADMRMTDPEARRDSGGIGRIADLMAQTPGGTVDRAAFVAHLALPVSHTGAP